MMYLHSPVSTAGSWYKLKELVRYEKAVQEASIEDMNADYLRLLKRKGFSDARLAALLNEKNQPFAR